MTSFSTITDLSAHIVDLMGGDLTEAEEAVVEDTARSMVSGRYEDLTEAEVDEMYEACVAAVGEMGADA